MCLCKDYTFSHLNSLNRSWFIRCIKSCCICWIFGSNCNLKDKGHNRRLISSIAITWVSLDTCDHFKWKCLKLKWGYVKLESIVLTFAATKLSLSRQTLLFSFSQVLNYLLHTLSWCLCLYFQCDISHSCDTFLSKWKAPDLEKMFSWQRMRSVVSASNPGRSSSANRFCLNWRHPLRFVVSSICFLWALDIYKRSLDLSIAEARSWANTLFLH